MSEDSYSDSEFLGLIGEDIVSDLARARFFEQLDDRLCPADPAEPRVACNHSFAGSIKILRELAIELYDIERILNFFRAQGARCDCETLLRFAPRSRFSTTCADPTAPS